MVNYNWDCKTVDAYIKQNEESDVVYNVHWRVTGVSTELNSEGEPYTVTNIGTQTLSTDSTTGFIPFDEVTNEEVVAWTKSAMGEEEVANLEANIASQIDLLINPTSVTLTIGE